MNKKKLILPILNARIKFVFEVVGMKKKTVCTSTDCMKIPKWKYKLKRNIRKIFIYPITTTRREEKEKQQRFSIILLQ